MNPTDEELDATWRQLHIEPTELEFRGDGTLSRRTTNRKAAHHEPTRDSLVGSGPRVVLGEVIAEGGMGVVHEGEQVSLARSVAVKSLRPVFAGYADAELLREARITGALEHPNVVPVHALERDEEGRLLIVMKRLVGEPWTTRIDDSARPLSTATLTRELEVFEQVCNAVAFAHQHGVLHRDIKPDNVVLGEFGEVCLVDWGLAVGLDETAVADLSPVTEVTGIEGTLPYLAPEQVAGRGDLLGVHTDVYLLGASLYHLLSGQPPHRIPRGSDDVRVVLTEIFTADPDPLPGWIPAELRSICERAMARTPAERFASARDLRAAVSGFRSHRESASMSDSARGELESAKARIAAGESDAPRVGRQLAAARFGFEQALRSWPNNPDARDGLAETMLATARRELAIARPDAASAVLDELPDELHAGSSLSMRIEELRADIAGRREHLEALERAARDSDLGQAARLRRGYGIGFGLVWLLAHVAMGVGARAGWLSIDHPIYLGVTAAIAVLFGVPALVMRQRLFPNLVNRRFANTLAIMLLAQVVVFAALWRYGVPFTTSLTLSLLQLAGSIAIKAELLARRASWTALIALGCAALSHLEPRATFELVGVAYATYFIRGGLLSWEDNEGALLMAQRD